MCRIGIRALDILNNLPPVRRKLIHRELISFASQLKPDHVFFAHHSQASEMMNSFLEEEWESAGDIVLELVNCPTENKTLRCWLRPRAGEPHAEPQTSLSQASLSRVPHSLQPGWERITDWLSQVAPGFAPITTDPAIRVNPHNSNLDARQAHSPIGKPKTCSGLNESAQSALQQDMMPEIQISSQAHDSIDVSKTCFGLDESSQCTLQHDVMPESQIPRSATSNQHGSGYDDFLARWGVNDQQSSRYYNDSAHWGVIHQQILGYSEFYRPEPWGVNQQQPLEHLQFQYPRFHQEQQYQRPQQGQLAQTNEPSQPRQQIPPTSEPEQFLQPQQSDNQAVSSPPKPLAPYPTITINFLADGVRPFDIDGGYCSEFRYLSYPNISTDVTVSFLMSTLRLQNVGMKGITVMLVRGKGFWGAGMTILEDSEMAEKTLAELGWGWEWRTVWLAVEM